MLLERIYEIDFATAGHSAARQTLDELEPIAVIYAAGDDNAVPIAAVFSAPDDGRPVHIPVTQKNELAWQQAKYVNNPHDDLYSKPEIGKNFQPDTIVPDLGELAEPQLGSWLKLVATYWSGGPQVRHPLPSQDRDIA